MRFIEVEPMEVKAVKPYHNLKAELTEFMNMNVKAARCRLDKDHYVSVNVARTTLYKAAKRYTLPIALTIRKGELYLIRTDM